MVGRLFILDSSYKPKITLAMINVTLFAQIIQTLDRFPFKKTGRCPSNPQEPKRYHQLDNRCFVTRPNPALSYFKTGDDIPSGSFSGEDCIRISNPQNLTIRETSSDLFQVLDGNSIPYAARSREEAERVIEDVQHYNAGFTCYVESPDPGMVYLRR